MRVEGGVAESREGLSRLLARLSGGGDFSANVGGHCKQELAISLRYETELRNEGKY